MAIIYPLGRDRYLSIHTQPSASLYPQLLQSWVKPWRDKDSGKRYSGKHAGYGCRSYNSWQQKPFWESLMHCYCNNEGTIHLVSLNAFLQWVHTSGRRAPAEIAEGILPALPRLTVLIHTFHPLCKPTELRRLLGLSLYSAPIS